MTDVKDKAISFLQNSQFVEPCEEIKLNFHQAIETYEAGYRAATISKEDDERAYNRGFVDGVRNERAKVERLLTHLSDDELEKMAQFIFTEFMKNESMPEVTWEEIPEWQRDEYRFFAKSATIFCEKLRG
jgi:hypothetical protein